MSTHESPESASLPVAPVDRWLAPVTRFLHVEAASGVLWLACTALALAIANSPLSGWFASLWKTPVSLSVGPCALAGDVGHLIVNDGLMPIFFFVVGLEIKREIVHGELRDPMKALLPVFAAVGGVVVPAAIFLTLQWGQPGQRGWAIPMATDIAFVVGFLALFGTRVPFGLKILLLSLAIVDDLVAVLIIAFVFTEAMHGAGSDGRPQRSGSSTPSIAWACARSASMSSWARSSGWRSVSQGYTQRWLACSLDC